MRTLPLDVEIAASPEDFAPPIMDDGRTLSWNGVINGRKYQLGLRPERHDFAAIAQAKIDLKMGVWQLLELGRLGRSDLMAYASAERHQGRPIPRL